MSPYFERLGLALDRLLNVFPFGGADTETVSSHAARAADRGERWACITCWVLAHLVERDHCKRTLSDETTKVWAASRAGFWIIVAFAVLIAGAHALVGVVF